MMTIVITGDEDDDEDEDEDDESDDMPRTYTRNGPGGSLPARPIAEVPLA